jgi:hypothetical protein
MVTAGSVRRRRGGGATDPAPDEVRDRELAVLGVKRGEAVRWRTRPGGHWQQGLLTRREPDGSIGVVDGSGRARSLALDRLEVRRVGRRGAQRWEPMTVRAARAEQLSLFA